MRISDWSSDVCSSDLLDHRVDGRSRGVLVRIAYGVAGHRGLMGFAALAAVVAVFDIFLGVIPRAAARGHRDRDEQPADDHAKQERAVCFQCRGRRSEEHTSELQSLMRNPYAVFCLKKKNTSK